MYLYDQLAAFTGIFAALSAAGPLQKGKISDYDLRWSVIEQSVDCRRSEERDPTNEKYIPKSRYSSINHYISDHEFVKDEHNDGEEIKFDKEYFDFLKRECPGMSDRLAEHFAKNFIRDPVPMYEGELIDD